MAGSKHRRLFSFVLLLLVAQSDYVSGQQVGVSLMFRGATIPNDSFVDIDDIMYTAPSSCCNDLPSNTNPRDEALLCVTDLVDCCDTPRTVRGDWYYPDGRRVELNPAATVTFRANRGPHEEKNGQTHYGSVRLFRQYSRPPERGHFRCELPSAADPNVTQTLCVNIVNFGYRPYWEIDPVAISPSGSSIAGETYSLTCLAALFAPIPLPSDVPSPIFQWFFGNTSLPTGVTPMGTFSSSNATSITYTSTLQFSPLSLSHAGSYTCRIGGGFLMNSAMITVNAPAISVEVTTSGAPVLGQNGYSLTCTVSGAENLNPSTTYQWTKNNDTQIEIKVGAIPQVLSFSPLRLFDAGQYTCQATVSSLYLNSSITVMDSQDVTLQIPSVSVQIRDGGATPTAGENYLLTCNVSGAENLNPTISYRWIKNSQTPVGTNSNTLSFTPLQLSDAASYICEVTISSSYLSGDIVAMNTNPQDIRIQIPPPSSLMLTSSGTSDIVIVGSDITLTCILVLNSAIVISDLSLLMVDAELSRNGTPLTLSGRIMTDTTFTYTTQLNPFGRSDSGNYTCTATVRPQPTSIYLTGNETLSSTIGIKAALPPPLNVQATQSSSSAPVEVSWNPPTDAAATFTRYRIHYGNGQNVLISSVTAITSITLKVDGNYVGLNVSIRSEADQLYSELLNVPIIKGVATDTAIHSCSCTSEVGIAIGAVIVVECLVVIVIVVLCLWRRKSSDSTNNKSDFTVSANMAYGEVNLKPRVAEGEYENPDNILKPSGKWNETTATNTYEAIDTNNLAAPEYASTEEAVCVHVAHHSS